MMQNMQRTHITQCQKKKKIKKRTEDFNRHFSKIYRWPTDT